MSLIQKLTPPGGPSSVILIRVVVGAVFLSEGIQKFLFPSELGIGRFASIGIPWPEIMSPFVAVVEISCGLLLVLGMLTRLASLAMVIEMIVALFASKLPLLLSRGLWVFAHESLADLAMLSCSIFLFIVGAGKLSVDAVINKPQ